MEQFSLEEYLKNPSRKVVTRSGRNVRIICTDKKGYDYPIVALIENKLEGFESVLYYTKDGEYTANESSMIDLFFAPEKHEAWINMYKTNRVGTELFDTQDSAEEYGTHHPNYVATIKIEWEE